MSETVERHLRVLEQTQWLPLPDLARYQARLIAQLVRHAHEFSPFYRDRLACLFDRFGNLDLSRWGQVPVLERAEAAANMSEMRARSVPEHLGRVGEFKTSGTTGVPLTFGVNSLVSIAARAAFARLARWCGADTSRPLARIRVYQNREAPQYPEGRTSKGWSGINSDAISYSLDLRTPVDRQLEWLERRKAPYLTTSPSNAMALAYAASPEQAQRLGLELVFSIAETVLPIAREIVSDRLGARLVGIYSCQEIGYMATECPLEPHYHVTAENALVEILGEDGLPAVPGEVGRVVVTGLYNYATPFIRFAIGDVASAPHELCKCGRSLPVISQIEGRTRCAFVFRDGTRIWPRAWNARALRSFVPFREFQMVQLDYERVEFRYVPDGGDQSPDVDGLQRYARQNLHPSIDMVAVPMDFLPRGPGGKLEHFVSHVSAIPA